MTGSIWTLLGVNLAAVAAVLSLLALPSFRTRDPSYVDAVWGPAFVLVAVLTYVQTDGDPTRSLALLSLCSLWGLRLGTYLLRRWRRDGPDHRYQAMLRKKKGGSDAVFLWTRVFLVQAVILSVVSLPVQLGQVYRDPSGLSPVNVAGIVLAVFGIVFESVSDLQLARFKAASSNEGRVLDQGLWALSRHPNYFGEACVWWGLFLVAVVNLPTGLSLIGPLLITVFLLKWSGVGLLERSLKQTKPGYVDYIASTSAFVPLPKRR